MNVLSIDRFPETLAVVRFGPGSEMPGWAESSSVFAITATATHTSVVCAARNVPGKARSVKPLTGFRAAATDGSRSATTRTLLDGLVEQGIEALVLDTFEESWLLVPAEQADAAEHEWRRRGHTVAPAVPVQH